jgi:hypothetical protein
MYRLDYFKIEIPLAPFFEAWEPGFSSRK